MRTVSRQVHFSSKHWGVFLLVLFSLAGCGPAGNTGSVSALLEWHANASGIGTRGALSGLVATVEIEVSAGQKILGASSCSYEEYRCTVDEVEAGGNRRVGASAFDSSGTLLYTGQRTGVEVIANGSVEVAVDMTPAYPKDIYPPARIDDLAASANGADITLTWTAVGDDLRLGRAERYDLRWLDQPLDEQNFDSANTIDTQRPRPAGEKEQMPVIGLPAGGHYYFAIKAIDDEENESEMSNVAEVVTGN